MPDLPISASTSPGRYGLANVRLRGSSARSDCSKMLQSPTNKPVLQRPMGQRPGTRPCDPGSALCRRRRKPRLHAFQPAPPARKPCGRSLTLRSQSAKPCDPGNKPCACSPRPCAQGKKPRRLCPKPRGARLNALRPSRKTSQPRLIPLRCKALKLAAEVLDSAVQGPKPCYQGRGPCSICRRARGRITPPPRTPPVRPRRPPDRPPQSGRP